MLAYLLGPLAGEDRVSLPLVKQLRHHAIVSSDAKPPLVLEASALFVVIFGVGFLAFFILFFLFFIILRQIDIWRGLAKTLDVSAPLRRLM